MKKIISQNKINTEIGADYFAKETDLVKNFLKAKKFYEKKHYGKCLKLLEVVLSEEPTNESDVIVISRVYKLQADIFEENKLFAKAKKAIENACQLRRDEASLIALGRITDSYMKHYPLFPKEIIDQYESCVEKLCFFANRRNSGEFRMVNLNAILVFRNLLDQAFWKFYEVFIGNSLSKEELEGQKVYFPVLTKQDNLRKREFFQYLAKIGLGKIGTEFKDLAEFLWNIQPLNSKLKAENKWLKELCELSNQIKHKGFDEKLKLHGAVYTFQYKIFELLKGFFQAILKSKRIVSFYGFHKLRSDKALEVVNFIRRNANSILNSRVVIYPEYLKPSFKEAFELSKKYVSFCRAFLSSLSKKQFENLFCFFLSEHDKIDSSSQEEDLFLKELVAEKLIAQEQYQAAHDLLNKALEKMLTTEELEKLKRYLQFKDGYIMYQYFSGKQKKALRMVLSITRCQSFLKQDFLVNKEAMSLLVLNCKKDHKTVFSRILLAKALVSVGENAEVYDLLKDLEIPVSFLINADISLNYFLNSKYSSSRDLTYALMYYSQALEINPSNEKALFGRALVFFFLKNWIKAEKAWYKLLNRHPKHKTAYYYLAKTLVELKRLPLALTCFKGAFRKNAEYIPGLKNYIKFVAKSNDLESFCCNYKNSYLQVKALVDKLLLKEQNNPFVNLVAGYFFYSQTNFEKASLYFKKTISTINLKYDQKIPKYDQSKEQTNLRYLFSEANIGLGLALLKMNQNEMAYELLRRFGSFCIEANPWQGIFSSNVWRGAGDRAFKVLVEHDPNNYLNHLLYAKLLVPQSIFDFDYSRKDLFGVIFKVLDRVLTLKKDVLEVFEIKADLFSRFEENKDIEQAEKCYQIVLKMDEDNVNALYGLGKLIVDEKIINRFEEAKILLAKARKLAKTEFILKLISEYFDELAKHKN